MSMGRWWFSILGVSRFRKERPFEAELTASK